MKVTLNLTSDSENIGQCHSADIELTDDEYDEISIIVANPYRKITFNKEKLYQTLKFLTGRN